MTASSGSSTAKRQRAYRRGHLAEWFAAAWLLGRGYRLLARRYKTKRGEIDLIVRRGSMIAFVEVKARQSLEAADDAIGGRAEQRIRNAADIWLSRHSDAAGLSHRFDVVLVAPWRLPRHIVNAF